MDLTFLSQRLKRLKLSAANQGICQHLPDLFHKQGILTPIRDPSNPGLCQHQHVVTQLSAQRSTALTSVRARETARPTCTNA